MRSLIRRFLRFFGFGPERVIEVDDEMKLEDMNPSRNRGRKSPHHVKHQNPPPETKK